MTRTNADRPTWDESFMFQAYLAATRSSCLQINTGTVIVKDKRIIASGYNGAPSKIDSCIKRGYCNKEKQGVDFHEKGTGTCIAEHAERNGMSERNRKELEGSTLYTVYYPCTPCTKTIIGNDIIEVVYSKVYKEKESLAKKLFEEAGVKVRQIDLDFDKMFEYFKKLK